MREPFKRAAKVTLSIRKADKADRLATLRARNAELGADQDERPRPDRIRNPDRPVAHRDDEPGDPNPNADEIWTDAERNEEKAAAEARKLTGELPEPISSWGF